MNEDMFKKGRLKKDSWLVNRPIAHRGFHSKEHPENSMGAFENAIRHDYAIEVDIHAISDGTLVVFHDNNTERMTGVSKNVKDLTLDDLDSLRLLGTQEKIPTLLDTLKVANRKAPLLIEIKDTSSVGLVENQLMEYLDGYRGEFAIQSFNPNRIKWLKDNAPHVIRGQLSGLFEDDGFGVLKTFLMKNLLYVNSGKPDFISYQIEGLRTDAIKHFRAIGYPVLSWTAKEIGVYYKSLQLCENVIFEGFEV